MAWKPDESPTCCPPQPPPSPCSPLKKKKNVLVFAPDGDRQEEGGVEGGREVALGKKNRKTKPPLVTVKEALGEEKMEKRLLME